MVVCGGLGWFAGVSTDPMEGGGWVDRHGCRTNSLFLSSFTSCDSRFREKKIFFFFYGSWFLQ